MCFEKCRNVYKLLSPWLILLFCILGSIIMGGTVRCFTVVIDRMRKEYGNRTDLFELDWITDTERGGKFMLIPVFTSLIATISSRVNHINLYANFAQALFMCSAYVATSLVYNPHVYFFTYSFLVAIGLSLFMANATLLVGEQFDYTHRFHMFATSAFGAGPLGSFVMCGINGELVRNLGWRWTLRCLAGALACVAVIGTVVVIFRTKPQTDKSINEETVGSNDEATPPISESNEEVIKDQKNKAELTTSETDPKPQVNWLMVLRKPATYAWFAHCAVHQAAIVNIMFNLANYLSHKYNMKKTNFVAILFYGIGTAISFFAWAIFGKFLRGYYRYVMLVAVIVAAIWLIIWNFIGHSLTADTVFAFFGGLFLHAGIASPYPVGEEILGVEGYYGYSVYNFATGMGILTAPLTSGLLADIFKFKYYFLFQAGLIVIDIVCVLVTIFLAWATKSAPKEPTDLDHLTEYETKSSVKQPIDGLSDHFTEYGTTDIASDNGRSK